MTSNLTSPLFEGVTSPVTTGASVRRRQCGLIKSKDRHEDLRPCSCGALTEPLHSQDPSTLLAVAMLELSPGSAVLDLCAAPGGKATLAAQVK